MDERPSRLHLWLALGYAVVVLVAAVTVVLPAVRGADPDAASTPEEPPPTTAADGVAEGRVGPT